MTNVNNPFDHIMYEFSMYLETSTMLSNDPFMTNLLIDSKTVHLRNLAYFFDSKPDCAIHAANYVNKSDNLLIDHKALSKIYMYTNNAACHMSKERLKSTYKTECAANHRDAFSLMCPYILKYVNALENDVRTEYKGFWEDKEIQALAQSIKSRIRGIKYA